MLKFKHPITEEDIDGKLQVLVKYAPSHPISIFIAGDYDQARNACKQFCNDRGLCVTVTPTSYIYTGGEQAGVIVGLINYPRFPTVINKSQNSTAAGYSSDSAWQHNREKDSHTHQARCLATFLCGELFQESFCIQGPDDTEWRSYRKDDLNDS